MAKDMFKALNGMRRWSTVATLALAFLLCFSHIAWGKSKGHHGRGVKPQPKGYNEEMLSIRMKDFRGGHKKSIAIARKRSKGRAPQKKGPMETRWKNYESLSPEEKARMKRKFRDWKSLPPERQELLRHRMKRWKELPPEERSRYKQRFQQWKSLSPEEQERIRQRLKKWNGLPHEEKEKIRRRFRK